MHAALAATLTLQELDSVSVQHAAHSEQKGAGKLAACGNIVTGKSAANVYKHKKLTGLEWEE